MKEKINVSDLPSLFTQSIESTFLLRSIQESQTQENRKKYYEAQLVDASGAVWGKIWDTNMKEEHLSMTGNIVTVQGLVTRSPSGAHQLVIRSMERADGHDVSDYIKGLTEEEIAKYTKILCQYIQSVKHDGYRRLAEELLSNAHGTASIPATLSGHHNYCGGFLVYTVSITCLVNHILRSLSLYDRHPDHGLDYQPDILTTAALLHAIGTTGMLTPYPDSRRVPASIPLGAYDMTMRRIAEAAALHPEFGLSETDLSLLLHVIGCAYSESERKPMMREALILRSAVNLQVHISQFDYFLAANEDKEGMVYDNTLGNYLYVKPREKKEDAS